MAGATSCSMRGTVFPACFPRINQVDGSQWSIDRKLSSEGKVDDHARTFLSLQSLVPICGGIDYYDVVVKLFFVLVELPVIFNAIVSGKIISLFRRSMSYTKSHSRLRGLTYEFPPVS